MTTTKFDNITISEATKELATLFDKYDWYYDTQIEGKSICVYVEYLNAEVMALVPDVVYGYQVKIGYRAYLTCDVNYGKASELINFMDDTNLSDDIFEELE